MILGGFNENQKPKDAVKNSDDIVILDKRDPNEEEFYLILTQEIYNHPYYKYLFEKDLAVIGYKSYIVVSSIMQEKPQKTGTKDLLAIESDWRKYLYFNGKKAKAIINEGRLGILNHSGDINYTDFMDMEWNPSRYFCGSEFVGGPDLWVYPIPPLKNMYPFEELGNNVPEDDPTVMSSGFRNLQKMKLTNLFTRFGRMQLTRALNQNMSTDELDMRPWKVEVPKTKEECNTILESLEDSELLSLDTETNSFDFVEGRLGCVQLCADGMTAYTFKWDLIDKRRLRKVLQSAKRITLANAKFDVRYLWQNNVTDWYPTDDTVLLAHTMNSFRVKGLKPSAWFYCGKFGGYDDALDVYKKKMKCQNYLEINEDILYSYAGLDAIVTWRLQQALDKHCHWIDEHFPNEKIPEWGIYNFYKEVMIPNMIAVFQVELDGVYFDLDAIEAARKYIVDTINEKKKELVGLWNVDPALVRYLKDGMTAEDGKDIFTSTTQLGALFKKMGWPEINTNAAGGYKTGDVELQEWTRLGMPGIKTLRELRSYTVGLHTFVQGWGSFVRHHDEDNTDRVHPSTNLFGTKSMRHAMNDPNFQQIPSGSVISKQIKSFFTVPPSRERIVVTDDSGKEWNNIDYLRVITQRGPVAFEDLIETDVISAYDETSLYD